MMNVPISNDSKASEKLLSALYRFSTTVHDENPKLQKIYIREVSVSQLNVKNGATKFQLLCKKYKFEDPHITPLIRKMTYVFDVLMVAVNPDGRITAIENEKEMKKKWERLKEELQKDHGGYVFENYIHSVDLTIYEKEKLIAFLESDKMYGLFFKSLWMLDNIDEMSSHYKVMKTQSTTKLAKRISSDLQNEQYIFQDNNLKECLKKNNHIQYEILCLGLKK